MLIVGGRSEVWYDIPAQQKITLQLMVNLQALGLCASYDMDGGNGATAPDGTPITGLNSEMGVRQRTNAPNSEWFQIIASNGYIRWDGMYRSTCKPVGDEEMIEEVSARWKVPVPPPSQGQPIPQPTPTATPPVSKCPLPWGPGRWVTATIENIGNPPTSQQVSVATKWCTEADDGRNPATGNVQPDGWPYECGTKCCRIGAHEGEMGLACESLLFGIPAWTGESTVRLVPVEGNPFNVKVAEGEGNISVCGSTVQPDSSLPCDSAHVKAQPGPVIE